MDAFVFSGSAGKDEFVFHYLTKTGMFSRWPSTSIDSRARHQLSMIESMRWQIMTFGTNKDITIDTRSIQHRTSSNEDLGY